MKKVAILSLTIVILLVVGIIIGNSVSGNKPEPVSSDLPTTAEVETEAPVKGPVDASWFDDAVFVGDSVTLKLSYYADSNPDELGDAQFFCAGSLGYANALWDIDDPIAVHPFYKGQNRLTEYCASDTGAKKVLIMLGMNDVGLYGVEATIENADTLTSRILKNSPDVQIYMQSTTPILYGHEIGDLNNNTIDEFNVELEKFAAEKGFKYIDVHSHLEDENGYLKDEYCSDPDAQGIHFTDAACGIWVDVLKDTVNK